jgi:hypothetical protein
VLGVRGRVSTAQRLPRGAVAVVPRHGRTPVALIGVGEGQRVGAERLGALRMGAVPAPGDDEGDAPLRVAQPEVQRREAAHGVPDDDRPVQPERVEDGDGVGHRAVL